MQMLEMSGMGGTPWFSEHEQKQRFLMGLTLGGRAGNRVGPRNPGNPAQDRPAMGGTPLEAGNKYILDPSNVGRVPGTDRCKCLEMFWKIKSAVMWNMKSLFI